MKKTAKDERAFSLIELMVALGVTSVVGIGVITMLSNQNQSISRLKMSYTMRGIADDIMKTANNLDALKASAELSAYLPPPFNVKNQKLLACISSDDENDCAGVSEATNQIPFALLMDRPQKNPPNMKELVAAVVAGGVEGTDSPSFRYDKDGKKCGFVRADDIKKRRSCVFYANATFWATCPAAVELDRNAVTTAANPDPSKIDAILKTSALSTSTPSVCPVAETIHVRVIVKHDSVVNPLPSIPDGKTFQKDLTFGAISTPTSAIPRPNTNWPRCPPNETATSVKEGTNQCECLFPFARTVNAGSTLCLPVETPCPPNTRFRGLYRHDKNAPTRTFCKQSFGEGDNGRPICCEVKCKIMPDLGGFCPVGYWMQKVEARPHNGWDGSCDATACSVGKNGGTCKATVNCKGFITCCSEPKDNEGN